MVIKVSGSAYLLSVTSLTVNTYCHQGTWQTMDIKVTENDFPNDNDIYHSEELRSHISTNDEGDENERQVFPQFNSNAKFVRFIWS